MVVAKNWADETLPCTRTSAGASRGPDSSTCVRNRDVRTSIALTAAG